MTQTEAEFKKIMDKTSEMVRRGELRNVLKMIQSELDVKDPSTMVALTMLAGLMRDKGDKQAAFDLFRSIYLDMNDTLGPTHKDTLSIIHNMALTSSSDSETNKLLVDIIAVSSSNGYDDLLKTFSNSLETFRRSLSMSKRRLYEKMDNQRSVKTKIKTISSRTDNNLSNTEIDSLILEFGLLDYDLKDKNKNITKKRK
jgi:hypothetical protein